MKKALEPLVIADASCLIALSKISRLDLLQALFERVLLTPKVAFEFGEPLRPWFTIESPVDAAKQRVLELELDAGESSAIALALEHSEALLLIDERKGRAIARRLGIRILGTLGCLIRARERNLISSLADPFQELQNSGFYLSEALLRDLIHRFDREQ